MAKRRRRVQSTTSNQNNQPEAQMERDSAGRELTGKSIVTFPDNTSAGIKKCVSMLQSHAGMSSVCRASDFDSQLDPEEASSAEMVVFDELGIAVMAGDPDQQTSVQSLDDDDMVVEPEIMNYALSQLEGLDSDLHPGDSGLASTGGSNSEYLRGYRDAVNSIAQGLGGMPIPVPEPREGLIEDKGGFSVAQFSNTASLTWGLQAVRADQSRFSGRGIKVAVLDTGFHQFHPDYSQRDVRVASFIPGESVQDGNGHGTHCIGSSCGPRRPNTAGIPGYGVAFEATIFAGKVLANSGSGSDQGILAGIDWALRNRCEIISMSLGAPTRVGERPRRSYEVAGDRALRRGSLIIAAAGNESMRPHIIRPVGSPANASTIVGVAALDSNLQIASFSNRGINGLGGEINLAGPGVNVFSSWPFGSGYRSISGTSMATPHVAGVAALLAESNTNFRGVNLYRELRRRARRLPLPQADVGNGLVEAT